MSGQFRGQDGDCETGLYKGKLQVDDCVCVRIVSRMEEKDKRVCKIEIIFSSIPEQMELTKDCHNHSGFLSNHLRGPA